MTRTGHRQLEHTADLALEMWAPTEVELLQEAARAVTQLLGPLGGGTRTTHRVVEFASIDRGDRLVQWLNELLYLATVDGFVAEEADVELRRGGLSATLRGQEHRALANEIKAATYHDLFVGERDGRWYAKVILDV